ncbi:MAG: hypothetical protein ACUVRC_09060 [Desulfotomaculales bacterium]
MTWKFLAPPGRLWCGGEVGDTEHAILAVEESLNFARVSWLKQQKRI